MRAAIRPHRDDTTFILSVQRTASETIAEAEETTRDLAGQLRALLPEMTIGRPQPRRTGQPITRIEISPPVIDPYTRQCRPAATTWLERAAVMDRLEAAIGESGLPVDVLSLAYWCLGAFIKYWTDLSRYALQPQHAMYARFVALESERDTARSQLFEPYLAGKHPVRDGDTFAAFQALPYIQRAIVWFLAYRDLDAMAIIGSYLPLDLAYGERERLARQFWPPLAAAVCAEGWATVSLAASPYRKPQDGPVLVRGDRIKLLPRFQFFA